MTASVLTREHDGGGVGIVGPGRGADAPVAGGTEDGAVLEDGRQLAGVVLEVPGVAQQGVRQAGRREQLLRGTVVGGQHEVGRVGARDARVGEEAHPGPLRRIDDVGVLGDALADLASGDEEEPVDTFERSVERRPVGVVGAAHHDTAVSQVGDGLGVRAMATTSAAGVPRSRRDSTTRRPR